MHEYSLAFSLFEALRARLAGDPPAGKVKLVHVRQGELLSLSHEALKEAWRIITEGTELSGSELSIELVPVRVRCPRCGFEGNARYIGEGDRHFRIPVLSCPECGARVEVVEGRDLAIVALTVEEEGGRGG